MSSTLVHNIVPGAPAASQTMAANRRPQPLDMRTRSGGALPAPMVAHSAEVMAVALRYATEATELAAELVANGLGKDLGLTVADVAALGVPRLQQLKADAARARAFASYDVNAVMAAALER